MFFYNRAVANKSVSAHAITLGKIMNEKILEQLEVNQNKYEEGTINGVQMTAFVVENIGECSDFDDVETLLMYCMNDESGVGLECAKILASKAIDLRETDLLRSVERNEIPVSRTVEMLILANSFSKYSRPNDKEIYQTIFAKAHAGAKDAFDYQLLANSLYEACNNIGDLNIDANFTLTIELIKKAADIAVEENNILCFEALAYMAKDRLKDKELIKSIAAQKKKIKK